MPEYREAEGVDALCLSAIPAAPPPPSTSLPLTCPPLLPARLPWQPLTCWDWPLIYLERAQERRGRDEWHFNVLLRCLVTSTIDHSAALHTLTPSLFPQTLVLAPGGRGLVVRRGMSFHVGLD